MKLTDLISSKVAPTYRLMVVTGIFNAGKTTFINSLCGRVWQDVEATIQVAYSENSQPPIWQFEEQLTPVTLGEIRIGENAALLLVETRGANVWRLVIEGANLTESYSGAILMLDSTKPETFRELKSIVEIFDPTSKPPIMIAANHQDSPEAWTTEHLRAAILLPETIPMLPCIATQADSAKQILAKALEIASPHPLLAQALVALRSTPNQ